MLNLLDYLEQVEQDNVQMSRSSSFTPKLSEKLGLSIPKTDTETKARLVALEVQLDDRNKTIQILENTLKQHKEREQDIIKHR